MKNKILLLIVPMLIVGIIFFICPEPAKKVTTYVGIIKEPWSKTFDNDSTKGYVVPFMLKDSLGKAVVINKFIIKGSAKEVGEMYQFVKDNVGQKCFVTTEETTTKGYERITEIVIK